MAGPLSPAAPRAYSAYRVMRALYRKTRRLRQFDLLGSIFSVRYSLDAILPSLYSLIQQQIRG